MIARMREYSVDEGTSRGGLLERPGFEVRHSQDRQFTLQLWGQLRPTWSIGLANGLADAGIRIVRGYARNIEGGRWLGDFQLEALDDAIDPVLLDYLTLARNPDALRHAPAPALTGYELRLTPKHGGSVYLEVTGTDQLGFLGGLLARILRAGLVPLEMTIDTRGLPVLDRFFLKGADGEPPTTPARQALAELLDERISVEPANWESR